MHGFCMNSQGAGVARWTALRTARWAYLLAAFAAAFVWVGWTGVELSWDRAHYHVYAGFQWVEGHWGRGFLPAGPQTFLNPLPYVPGYWLTKHGASEWQLALIMAAVHALPWLCAGYAFLTPAFLVQLGTSSADATTAVFVLCGVWCCLRARLRGSLRWAVAAGGVFGCAAALKLTNAMPALLAPLLLIMPMDAGGPSVMAQSVSPARVGQPRLRSRRALCWGFALALLIGFVAVSADWSLKLYRATGNPWFPFLNALFQPVTLGGASDGHLQVMSPSETKPAAMESVSLAALVAELRPAGSRFVPASLGAGLLFPWDVAHPSRTRAWSYLEAYAPDPRLLIGALLILAGLMRAVHQRVVNGAMRTRAVGAGPLRALTGFCLLWYGIWVFTTGNGRYGLALLMLLSVPLLQAVMRWLAPGRGRVYVLALLLGVQAVYALGFSDRLSLKERFDWSQSSLWAPLPESLRTQPWLHVSVQPMSWSYWAPQLHPASEFATTYAACEGCPSLMSAEVLQRVLAQWDERVRIWIPVDEIRDGKPRLSVASLASNNAALGIYNRRVRPEDCVFVEPAPNIMNVKLMEFRASTVEIRPSLVMASCRVAPALGAAAAVAAIRTQHDGIFETIEAACRDFLGGSFVPTRWNGLQRWERQYAVREIRVQIRGDEVEVSAFGVDARRWGRLDQFEAGKRLDCEPLRQIAGVRNREGFDASQWGAPLGTVD